MAEYQGITYTQKTSRTQKDGSIEVDVEFVRDDIQHHTTFRFLHEKFINGELQARCERKINKFVESRERDMTDTEKSDVILKYLESSKTVTVSKESLLNLTTEKITIARAI